MEQTDIVPVLKSFDLSPTDGAEEELLVTNPPTIKVDEPVASDWSET